LPRTTRNEGWILLGLLLFLFAIRVIRLDQPILENYVGRQVPTAMVARNLARGSGFLFPTLDTGPFPSLFLVEPPIDGQVVAWLSSLTGIRLDSAGRLVSAAATTLAAWGLFGLVHRRSGFAIAVATLVAFAAFPVSIRYGRAFQPDALAMGLAVAGLRFWDSDRRSAMAVGWLCLFVGLAQKATWAFVLVPLVMVILDRRSWRVRLIAVCSLLWAVCWYVYASRQLDSGPAAASSDNAARWLSRLSLTAFLQPAQYARVARDLLYRAFNPLGFGLAAIGLAGWTRADRLWRVWMIAASVTMLGLFGKLHHDYYWIMMAPPVAAWAGMGIGRIGKSGHAVALLACLLGLGLYQSRSTWITPDDWRDAPALAKSIRRFTNRDDLIIAPEAVLYLGDRRGCRLEYEAAAARRAANEWRPSPAYAEEDPAALIDFYRTFSGARFFADLVPRGPDPERDRLHLRVKSAPRVRVLDDQPGRYLLVEFEDPRTMNER
jgi:hypothetical protein